MILKFKANVDISFDNEENVETKLPLFDIWANEPVDYEIWIEKNSERLKSLTIIVPKQKVSFKHKIEEEILQFDIELISCEVEGDKYYAVNLSAIELQVIPIEITKDQNLVKIIAKGVLFFDGEE